MKPDIRAAALGALSASTHYDKGIRPCRLLTTVGP